MNTQNAGRQKRIANGKRGSALMEVVIVCVLVAAACLIGVIAFGRAIFRSTDVMDKGLTGQGNLAGTALSCPAEGYRKQAEDDISESKKFAGEFSDTKQ